MSGHRLIKSTTYVNQLAACEPFVITDVTNNPGTTVGQTAQRLDGAFTSKHVERSMEALFQSNVLARGPDGTGEQGYWISSEFTALVNNNYSNAKAWVDNNDEGLVDSMVVALNLPHAVVQAIALRMHKDSYARIVPG